MQWNSSGNASELLAPLNLSLMFLFPSAELFLFFFKVRLKKKANKLWSRVQQREQMFELVWTCSKVLMNYAGCKHVYQKVQLDGNFWFNIDPSKICQYIFISRQCQLTVVFPTKKKKKFVFIAISTKISKKTILRGNIRSYIPKQENVSYTNYIYQLVLFLIFIRKFYHQAVYHTFRLHVIGSYFSLLVVSFRDQSDQRVILRITFKLISQLCHPTCRLKQKWQLHSPRKQKIKGQKLPIQFLLSSVVATVSFPLQHRDASSSTGKSPVGLCTSCHLFRKETPTILAQHYRAGFGLQRYHSLSLDSSSG